MEVDDEWEFSAEELDSLEREALQQIAQRHNKPFPDPPSYKVKLSPFSLFLFKYSIFYVLNLPIFCKF